MSGSSNSSSSGNEGERAICFIPWLFLDSNKSSPSTNDHEEEKQPKTDKHLVLSDSDEDKKGNNVAINLEDIVQFSSKQKGQIMKQIKTMQRKRCAKSCWLVVTLTMMIMVIIIDNFNWHSMF